MACYSKTLGLSNTYLTDVETHGEIILIIYTTFRTHLPIFLQRHPGLSNTPKLELPITLHSHNVKDGGNSERPSQSLQREALFTTPAYGCRWWVTSRKPMYDLSEPIQYGGRRWNRTRNPSTMPAVRRSQACWSTILTNEQYWLRDHETASLEAVAYRSGYKICAKPHALIAEGNCSRLMRLSTRMYVFQRPRSPIEVSSGKLGHTARLPRSCMSRRSSHWW